MRGDDGRISPLKLGLKLGPGSKRNCRAIDHLKTCQTKDGNLHVLRNLTTLEMVSPHPTPANSATAFHMTHTPQCRRV